MMVNYKNRFNFSVIKLRKKRYKYTSNSIKKNRENKPYLIKLINYVLMKKKDQMNRSMMMILMKEVLRILN